MKGKKIIIADHRGESLVEVMIAVTVMLIILLPVFRVMTASIRMNIRALESQNVNLLAESIMESFKADRIEKMCSKYTDYIFDDATGEYLFEIKDMKASNTNYDIEVKATPVMQDELFALKQINPYKDALFQEKTSYLITDATQDFTENHMSDFLEVLNAKDKMNNYSEEDVDTGCLRFIKKETTLKVSEDAGETKAIVSIRYYYKMKDYQYIDVDEETDIWGNVTYKTREETFDYPEEADEYMIIDVDLDGTSQKVIYINPSLAGPERIYLMYFADYNLGCKNETQSYPGGYDIFYIEAPEDVTVYLIRQIPSTYSETELTVKNNAYCQNINESGGCNVISQPDFKEYQKKEILLYDITLNVIKDDEVVMELYGTNFK